MGDKQNGRAALSKGLDARGALFLEAFIPTPRISSTINTSGSLDVATEKPRRAYMPEE